MPERIPQSTTLRVPLRAYLSTDHLSAAAGKTIAVTISKNGAAFGNPSGGATNAVEIANGWYYVDLTTTDTGTTGPLVVYGTATGVDTVEVAYDVADPTAVTYGVNVVQWKGTAVASPATAGIPDVNMKNANNVAATSITTINANLGTTQPTNFTGTAGSALVKSDMVDIAGSAVSTSTAQIGVNAVNLGGTAQTGRDLGASVLLSPGTGTGQLDITSGVVKANLVQILGTALTETAGQIAAAFKQFFNIASPTSTMNVITTVTTTTTATTATNLTNAPTAGDFTAAMKTSLNAATPTSVTTVTGNVNGNVSGNVTGSVGSVLGNVAGTVASVVGNVGGNVVGSVGSVVATVSANLTQILGTALTETAGNLAAGFKKWFNVNAPTSTMNEITLVDTMTTYTGNTPQTGDSFARIGAAGAGLTALGDTRIANLDAAVSSRTKPADTQARVTLVDTATVTTTATNLTNAPTNGDFTAVMKTSLNAATPASVVGAVGSVTGNVGGNVTGSVGSVLGNVAGSVASVVGNVGGNVIGTIGSLAAQAKTDVGAAVLDVAGSAHNIAGTIGALINSAGSGGSVPTVQQIVNGVWDELSSAHLIAGTMGLLESLLAGINSRTLSPPVNINTGGDTNVTLNITQTVTYSAANGNRKQVNVSVTADPTLAVIKWVFLNGNVETTFAGTFVSYDSGTGIAVVAMADFTATKAEFPAPSPLQLAQQAFTVSIALPTSAGNLVPLGYHTGKVYVQAAGTPS